VLITNTEGVFVTDNRVRTRLMINAVAVKMGRWNPDFMDQALVWDKNFGKN